MRSKLTDHVRATVVVALEDGQTVAEACQSAGIAHSTHRDWMARARREPDGAHAAYATAILAAQQRRGAARGLDEAALVAIVEDGARSSWRAAAWLLERRWPERWATASSRRKGDSGQEQERNPFDSLDELAARRGHRGDGPAA
jgi:transposase-like protein